MQESMSDFPEFFPLCPVRERKENDDYVYWCLGEAVTPEGWCRRHRGMKDGRYEWEGLEVVIPRSALALKELARRKGAC